MTTADARIGVQKSIRLALLVEFGIQLPVIQIGAFWQSTGNSAQTLSDLLGIAVYRVGTDRELYSGFPVNAVEMLDEVRRSDSSWAIVGQVGVSGQCVVREVLEAQVAESVGVRFEGAIRV